MSRVGNRFYPGRYMLGSWRDLDAGDAQSMLEQQVMATERVTVVRCVYREGGDYPEHFHPQEQITIVEEGALEFTVAGERVEVGKGQMISILPNVRHATKVPGGSGRAIALNLFLRQVDQPVPNGRANGIPTYLRSTS